MMRRILVAAISAVLSACAMPPASPSVSFAPPPPAGSDAETQAWWAITGELSADALEGRDTGSEGYDRAAKIVVARFQHAGLKPGGEDGKWTQRILLHEAQVEKSGTRFDIVRANGGRTNLDFLRQITVRATDELPASLDASLSFRGYCSAAEMSEKMFGKVAVCFGGRRRGVPSAADRIKAAIDAGAVGLINVDDPGFTIEPARWPEAYARSVSILGAPPIAAPKLAVMRLSPAALADVIEGSGFKAEDILLAGAASQPLPSFNIPARLQTLFKSSQRNYFADNVLGLLPGVDPKLAPEVVVVSAHLDGYGIGEAVAGDTLYNGAFDDAAYVAALIRLAENRHGKGFRRTVLFAAFTGEEKGLLGSTWFTQHPTVSRTNLAADINLDQLRPLFALKILTMHAINDTTLGAMVLSVAKPMGIEIREDREPERNLNSRADHYPFLRAGVPATGFIFGFNPGTEAERRYREWYQVRYHRPQDDMTQPIDFKAAADFNRFFYRLTAAVADADARPSFLPGSAFAPH